MSDRKLVLRTADQSRRADIEFDQNSTGSEIIQAAVDNWSLPSDMDYTLVNTTTGQVLSPSQALNQQVSSGDVLEVQPVLVAGAAAVRGGTRLAGIDAGGLLTRR